MNIRAITTKAIASANLPEIIRARFLANNTFLLGCDAYYSALNGKASSINDRYWQQDSRDTASSLITKVDRFLTLINGRKILDIGCGQGGSLLHMAGLGYTDITGIDINTDSIETTRRRLSPFGIKSASLHVLDIKEDPLPNTPYKGIFLSDVLLYFSPPQQAKVLHKVYEGLTPQGILFVRWALGDYIVRHKDEGKDTERHTFEIGTPFLKALLECTGFDLIGDIDIENVPLDHDPSRIISYMNAFVRKT